VEEIEAVPVAEVAAALAAIVEEEEEEPAVVSATEVDVEEAVASATVEVVEEAVDAGVIVEAAVHPEVEVAVERAQRVACKSIPSNLPQTLANKLCRRVVIEPHRHPGVFVARGKEDLLVTKNLTPGESVYGEKRISVSNFQGGDDAAATSTEYRVWNPFRSKIAAGILGGIDDIHIKPGSKVLYLGAASGTSVSHIADIVGPEGTVYAVEFSHRSGRDLINMATHRTNVIPIVGK
jgi:hypothetical protein